MTKPHIIYITGGAQGIGLGIAHTLLTDGYRVAITDIPESVKPAPTLSLSPPASTF